MVLSKDGRKVDINDDNTSAISAYKENGWCEEVVKQEKPVEEKPANKKSTKKSEG